MNIFATHAPAYWEAGLPAIPLMPREKRPAIQRWQLFADTLPTEDERSVWMGNFPNGNIGLPMGPAAGLVAIDIDTDDEKVLAVLNAVLPPSPWTRVGKKGAVRIYRYNGERTIRIKGADGAMICEILSKGTQFVLPPSIHPDTGRQYTSNTDLLTVFRSAPLLPDKVDVRIREAFKAVGIEVSIGSNNKIATFVPAGARDNAMVWHAGLLARVVLKGERSLLQALGEMETWVNTFTEQIVGDPVSVDKARAKVVEFLIRDVTRDDRTALPIGWDDGLTDEDKQKLGLSFTDDDECWSSERIINGLEADFLHLEKPNSSEWQSAIAVALRRVVKSKLEPMAEGAVLQYIHSQSRNTVRLTDLRRQLKEMRSDGLVGDNHSEIAQAALEHLCQFGSLQHHAYNFWQWNGAHWQQRADTEIIKVVAESFGNLPASKKNGDYTAITNLIATFASEAIVPSGGVNFANGFLSEDLDLKGHDPKYGMTYTLPYRYSPGRAWNFPLFEQLLVDAWGQDADYENEVLALQEALGATIMQRASAFQRAFLLFGRPSSGKSTFVKVFQELLPPGTKAAIPPELWSDKFLPAQMFGKIFNFAGELSETQFIPGKQFKEIVTGEPITGQHKNGQPFQFEPATAHWFQSNFLPKTKDPSDGFNRRWLIFDFPRRLDEAKKRPDFHREIVASDAEAIAAWAIEGYKRLKRENSYTLPASHFTLVERMASANNSVRYFLTKCANVIVGLTMTTATTSSDVLFAAYDQFMMRDLGRAVKQQKFEDMMEELSEPFGFEVHISGGRSLYRGVTLK